MEEYQKNLICSHLSFADMLAKKKKAKSSLYYEDLQSAAYYGLVDAALKYDGKKPFEKYAVYRINGEMEEEIEGFYKHAWQRREELHDVEQKEKPNWNVMGEVLNYLNPREKNIFRLYYQEELTMKEIAERLGVSQKTVWDCLDRSKEKLLKNKDVILEKIVG